MIQKLKNSYPLDSFYHHDKVAKNLLLTITLRYLIACSSLIALLLWGELFPFPYLELIYLTIGSISANTISAIMLKQGKDYFSIVTFTLYSDILCSAFALTFTGGFVSPFIVVYCITTIEASNSLPQINAEGSVHSRYITMLFLMLYLGTSFGQKFEYLPVYMDYTIPLMQENSFFYFVVLIISTLILICHFLVARINKEVVNNFSGVISLYQNIIRELADDNSEEFYNSLVKSLAHVLHVKSVALLHLGEDSKDIQMVSAIDNGVMLENKILSVKLPIFQKVIKNRIVYFRHIPNDYDVSSITRGTVSSFLGYGLEDKYGNVTGLLCVSSDTELLYNEMIDTVLKVFAVRALDKMERDGVEKEKKIIKQQYSHTQKMEVVGQLAGGIAHDFNNMLSAIMGNCELLKMKLHNSPHYKYADRISTISNRAGTLIKQLLSFARKGKNDNVLIGVKLLLKDTGNMLLHTLDKRVKLVLDFPDESEVFVTGDQGQLQNMILNLGINAGDAMPNGGTLTLSVKKIELTDKNSIGGSERKNLAQGTYCVITVKDTGIGIDSRYVSKMFEPFFTTKKSGKGTGLGLSAVYGTIEEHNGDVVVKSQVGVGTTFYIYLPINKNERGEKPKNKTELIDITSKVEGKHILLIDDEEDILKTYSEAFESKGMEVSKFTNGIKAVQFYRKHYAEIDLIILDINMPEISGVEVYSQCMSISKNSRFIIATGYSPEMEKLQNALAVVCTMIKPVEISDMYKTVQEILSEN